MGQTNLVNLSWPRTPFRFLATFLAMCQLHQKCLALGKTLATAAEAFPHVCVIITTGAIATAAN